MISKLGDNVVASHHEKHEWESKYNYEIDFKYPVMGSASIISYVEIIAHQVLKVYTFYVLS